MANLEQVSEGEFEANREHQEDDPDLGEALERAKVGHRGAWRERADKDAPEHIAEDQRLAREPRQASAEDGGHEHVGQVPENQRLGQQWWVPSSWRRLLAGVLLPSEAGARLDGRATRRVAWCSAASGPRRPSVHPGGCRWTRAGEPLPTGGMDGRSLSSSRAAMSERHRCGGAAARAGGGAPGWAARRSETARPSARRPTPPHRSGRRPAARDWRSRCPGTSGGPG